MKAACIVFGTLCLIFFVIGCIPCFGWLAFLNLFLSLVGIIVGICGATTLPQGKKGPGIACIIMCSISLIFGGLRVLLVFVGYL